MSFEPSFLVLQTKTFLLEKNPQKASNQLLILFLCRGLRHVEFSPGDPPKVFSSVKNLNVCGFHDKHNLTALTFHRGHHS